MEKINKIRKGGAFFKIIYFSGISVVILVVAIFLSILISSFPSIKEFGFSFFSGKTWDPVFGNFAALPFIVGTMVTSILAIIISTPFSIAVSLSMGEYFSEGRISGFLKTVIELVAGIPSVIYGFWGLFVLTPIIRWVQMKFDIVPYGVGIFTSSVVLAIMIIPYSASLGSEVIGLIPRDLKEAAYSLGATRYEVIKKVILPYARSGISAGILLALGRALGETMAVTMLIGNSNFLPTSIFSPANTMASIIANEFSEATETLYLSSLLEIGLILMLVSTVVNIVGKFVIKKFSV